MLVFLETTVVMIFVEALMEPGFRSWVSRFPPMLEDFRVEYLESYGLDTKGPRALTRVLVWTLVRPYNAVRSVTGTVLQQYSTPLSSVWSSFYVIFLVETASFRHTGILHSCTDPVCFCWGRESRFVEIGFLPHSWGARGPALLRLRMPPEGLKCVANLADHGLMLQVHLNLKSSTAQQYPAKTATTCPLIPKWTLIGDINWGSIAAPTSTSSFQAKDFTSCIFCVAFFCTGFPDKGSTMIYRIYIHPNSKYIR